MPGPKADEHLFGGLFYFAVFSIMTIEFRKISLYLR